MNALRVVLDTNVFTRDHFDLIDSSPMRALCKRGKIVPVYAGVFFEEMARAYMRESVRADLLNRWLPFISETADRFCEDVPTIWRREVIRGAGRKALIYMKPRVQREMIDRMRKIPPDGSWPLIRETDLERKADIARLHAQRELSKQMRNDVASAKRALSGKASKTLGDKHARTVLIPIIGRGMIERHFDTTNPMAVASRWARDPANYPYFTQFVTNMVYKEPLYGGSVFANRCKCSTRS